MDRHHVRLRRLAAGTFAVAAWLAASPDFAHEGHIHDARPQHDHARALDDAVREAGFASRHYSRSQRVYIPPEAALLNADGRRIRLPDLLDGEGPVLIDFIYTGCTSACPAVSRMFSDVSLRLAPKVGHLRLISISIDPRNDQPAQLKRYAKHFGAHPNWQFLTGRPEDIDTVLRAFDNYHGERRDYTPIVLLRPARGRPWLRIEGPVSADELAREYLRLARN